MASATVHLMMIGWIPAVFVLFAVMPVQRAIVASVVFGWLFLPMYGYDLAGLPPYTKSTAVSYVVVMAAALLRPGAFLALRPSLLDAPMLVWCLCPIASSLSNDLGLYDGLSSALMNIVTWGLAYALGRAYLSDAAGVRTLAIGVVIGGLLYMPLCLYEIKMSPQLHRIVYGYFQHGFVQTLRFGGFRPMVFMQHGLAVGTFMASAALIATWAWAARAPFGILRLPAWAVAVPLLATAVLCKSLGALALLALGFGAMLSIRLLRSRIVLAALIAAPIAYMGLRTVGAWSGDELAAVAATVSQDRADSLRVRLENENVLIARALERPLFGWGGWNRARIIDESGKDKSITDGLWIIVLGNSGLVGLASVSLVALLPPAILARRMTPEGWRSAGGAWAGALATLLALHAIDNLFNAMFNPLFVMSAGGLVGLCARRGGRPARAIAQAPRRRRSGSTRGKTGSPAAQGAMSLQ